MADTSLLLHGVVVDGANGRPAPGVVVLVVDRIEGDPSVMATATSDGNGTVAVPLELDDLVQLFRAPGATGSVERRQPTLHLLGMRSGSVIGRSTVTFTLAELLAGATRATLRVHEAASTAGCDYVARGRLVFADGSARVGAGIELVQHRLRGESVLATGTTDIAGAFELRYRTATPCDPSSPGLTLSVRARAGSVVLAHSARYCNAPPELEVTLVVGDEVLRGPSTATVLEQALTGRLDGIGLHDLTADEVELLACATRRSARELAWLARSDALAQRTGVSRNVFFALAHAGVPLTLGAVLGLPSTRVRSALTRAQSDNVVPPWGPGALDAVVAALAALALDATYQPSDPRESLLGRLFEHAGVSALLPRQFVESYLARTGTVAQFWTDFRRDHGDAASDTVQFTLHAAAVTGNHVPLVAALQRDRTGGRLPTLRVAARRSAADWLTVLRAGSSAIGAPVGFPGDTETERIELYAQTLERAFEHAFPTEVTAAVLRSAGGPAQIADFVGRNPTFDFEDSHIATFLASGAVLPPGADANLGRDLRVAQRLHTVVPMLGRRTTLPALRAAGITSARQIHNMGLGGLAHRLPDLDRTVLTQIHERASQAAARATTLFMKYGAPAQSVPIAILLQFIPPQLPTVEGLLGRMDFCACTSCRSIYSPAAYLADILRFLEDRGLLGALIARRPDLVHVRLGCHNTNTVMPAIDLAIEVLEDRVASPPAVHRQTEWTAAELRAHPEHLNATAYSNLAAATFPWVLPFDLRRVEARSYLEQMGVPFAEVLDATLGHRPSSGQARAVERLGLSTLQAAIITGEHDFDAPGDPWGLHQGNWVATLAGSVRTVLRRAGASYDELLDLGHTSYAGGFTIVFPDDSPCDLGTASFIDLLESRLLRMHRFMRLRAALGGTIAELDATLRALGSPGANRLDAACLERLAVHVQLGQRFRSVPVYTRLAWWGRIDTRRGRDGAPSFYDALFLDRTLAPDNAAFGLDDDRLELAQNPGLSATHRSVIQAALSISEGELAALLASTTPPMSTLDLHTLSRLYRRATLARALELSVTELLAIAEISGAQPFADDIAIAAPDVDVTARFIAIADTIRNSGSSVAELDYVLRGTIDATSGTGLTDLAVATRFVELIRGLQQIRQDTTRDTDTSRTDRDRLVAALPKVIDAEWVDRAIAFIHDLVEPAAGLAAQLERFLPPAVQAALFDSDDPRSGEQRTTDTLDALLAHLRRVATEDLVVQKLADAVGVEPAMGALLLGGIAVAGTGALALFAQDSFAQAIDFATDGPAIAASGFPPATWGDVANHAIALRRLHAAALLVRRFDLTHVEVEALLPRASAVGWLDLLAFPDTPVSGPSPAFEPWFALSRILRARNRAFTDRPEALLALLDAPAGPVVDDTFRRLATAAGRSPDEFVFVASTSLELDGTTLRDADRFEQLVHVFDVLERLGVAASRLFAWTAATTTPAIAQAIKNTARSKVAPEAWPEVIGPLRDQLRAKQRDALVARVLDQLGLTHADDLLARLLVDVQGEPCQRTSRIKHAISSVQTFVQRVVLNLEPGLSLSDDSVREWSWMSRFRVWEANRNVFLYPENYLEPALRGDVTPQFRAFIDEVAGSDGEPPRLEDAYRHYLAGLVDIARLSVCGVYRERETGTNGHLEVNNLHVVARSEGEPHRFYYRKQVDQTYWTPWEEIPGKIEYDCPTPVVWKGKLLLLWLVIREVTDGPPPGENINRPAYAPAPSFEARLGSMERRNGQWTRPSVSEAIIRVPGRIQKAPPSVAYVESKFSIGFDTRMSASTFAVELVLGVAIYYSEPGEAQSGFVRHDGFVVYADGSIRTKERSNWVFALVGPKPSSSRLQAFECPDGVEVEIPIVDPHFPGSVKRAPIVATDTVSEFVGNRRSYGELSGQVFSEEPFFFQDLRRAYLVEPRNVYSAASGSQVNSGFAAVEDTQQVNVGMYVPSQTFVASTSPPPSAAATVLDLDLDAGVDAQPLLSSQPTWQAKGFDFSCFYHPYASSLVAMLEERGLASFLSPPEHGRWSRFHRQSISSVVFAEAYDPGPHVDASETVENIDFDRWGAYAVYNWELFFHAPMLVARQLVTSGRYDEARRWIHAVLNPHDASSDPAPARYWQLKPFFEASVPENIADELETLSYSGPDGSRIRRRRALEKQIEAWRKNPFEPHLIAQLRPAAYQRYTVMQYLDTLIAWGDALFRQDTIESINEATQLYVLAAQMLGPRPQQIERRTSADLSYAELAPLLDDMSNAIVELENVVPGSRLITHDLTPDLGLNAAHIGSPGFSVPLRDLALEAELADRGPAEVASVHFNPALGVGSFTTTTPIPEQAPSLYFCIPPNDKMLRYWDTVADRLFKIRSCLDLEGVFRELPLFEPPIDPALLVRARAAGLDISSALSALSAPLPHHRFRTMLAVAKELCADVRGLGQSLAQALERKDAETLAELRAGQERGLLQSVRAVREAQIEEALANRRTLEQARLVAQQRLSFVAARARRIKEEQSQPQSLSSAKLALETSRTFDDMAAVMGLIPNFAFGTSGIASPVLTATLGGSTYAAIYGAVARHIAAKGQGKQIDASIAGIQASLIRRDEEWTQEAALAQLELDRIDKELAAVDIRIALAEKELDNHDHQVRNAEDVEAFLRDRFTNAELYGQMASELGRVYFAAYRLAFDLAKQAERAYQYELAAPSATFVEFGYWDNQRKGLLAGDKLMHDLRRMEVAHLEHNRRELELSKLVSLALVDPMALELLRDTGTCFFRVPEVLYDLDHPGHYLRRIKSVSVTLPLVEGAHGNVTGMLTLVESSVRRAPSLTEPPVADPTADLQQIGLSTGLDDAGLFERSFGDERRLPFEGHGAASLWRLELPRELRQFDYRDISDVVLRIAYTARNGGELLRNQVVAGISAALGSFAHPVGTGQVRYLSLAATFAEAWAAFAASTEPERVFEFDLGTVHFPSLLTRGTVRIGAAWLVTQFVDAPSSLTFAATMPTGAGTTLDAEATVNTVLSAANQPAAARVRHGALAPIPAMNIAQPTTGRWRISISTDALPDVAVLRELGLLLQYTVVP